MKVFFGGIVSKASGKFVNMVFSVWRGLPVVREFVAPTQPRTARQLSVNATFKEISQYWANALPEGLRQAWANFVFRWTDLWANEVSLTGLNLFLKFNFILRDSGRAFQTTTPPPTTPSEISDSGIIFLPDEKYVNLGINQLPAGEISAQHPFIDIWLNGKATIINITDNVIQLATTGQPQAVNPVKSDYKHFYYADDTSDALKKIELQIFETITDGQGVGFTSPKKVSIILRRYNKHGNYSSVKKYSIITA